MFAEKLKFLFVFCGIGLTALFLLWLLSTGQPRHPENADQTQRLQQTPAPQTVSDDNKLQIESGLLGSVSDGRTYSVLIIDKEKNHIPTGTDLFVQGSVYQVMWPKDGDCFRLMTSEHPNVQHGYDSRLSCRYSLLLTQKNVRGEDMWPYASLVCDTSPKEFLAAARRYPYGSEVQVHGKYAPSLDFEVANLPGMHIGTPLLKGCEFTGPTKNVVRLDSEAIRMSTQSDQTDEAKKIYSLMDKATRDHPADGEGSDLIPPRLLHNAALTYPVDALPMGTSGTVTVGATVEIDGTLSNIHIVKSVSPLLDAAALQAFSTNQFEPARNSITNAPVASDVTQNLSFTPPTQPARSPLRPSADAPAPIARQAPQ